MSKRTRRGPRKRVGPKLDRDRLQWMKQYGLSAERLSQAQTEHLRKCTKLGREILLIMMRIELQGPMTPAVDASIKRIGEEHRRERAAKKLSREERLARHRERQRNRARMKRELHAIEPEPEPEPAGRKHFPPQIEPAEVVDRLVELAFRARVA